MAKPWLKVYPGREKVRIGREQWSRSWNLIRVVASRLNKKAVQVVAIAH